MNQKKKSEIRGTDTYRKSFNNYIKKEISIE